MVTYIHLNLCYTFLDGSTSRMCSYHIISGTNCTTKWGIVVSIRENETRQNQIMVTRQGFLTFNHTSVTSHKSKLVKSLFCLAVQASNPSWVKCPGMVIRYHSVETFPPNVTLDHCKQLCLSLPNCLCKSIDYRPSGGRCSPNNVSRLYAGTSWRMKAAYDFYEYTCLTEGDLCSNSITATDSCGQKCLPDFLGQYGRHMSQTICNYKHRIILYQFDF